MGCRVRSRRGGGASGAVLAVMIVAVPAWTSAQLDEAEVGKQVVKVRVFKGDDLDGTWSGVVVNDQGDVLTSAEVLAGGRRVTVVVSGETEEREAVVQWREDGAGLGLLRVEELERSGLVFSEAGLAPGEKVFAVMPREGSEGAEFVEGTVGVVEIRSIEGAEVRLMQHSAMVTARGYGSPLVNECGQMVGLNVPDPKEAPGRLQRKKQPRDTVFAFGGDELVPRLGERGVEFVEVAEACGPAEAPAQEEAQPPVEEDEAEPPAQEEAQPPVEEDEAEPPAQEEAQPPVEEDEAEPPAQEEAQPPVEEDEAEPPAQEEAQPPVEEDEAEPPAQEEAQPPVEEDEAEPPAQEEAQPPVEEDEAEAPAQEEAEKLEVAVYEAAKRMERLKRFALWGGAAGVALLLVLTLFWVLSARRSRDAMRTAQVRAAAAEQETAEARRRAAPAPFDCVLSGRDGGGAVLALNLRRDALVVPGGAIIGRDPARSSHVVMDSSVSRAHARVSAREGVLHVEDLGSTNGTFLNGRRLVEGQGVRTRDGDELVLGALAFRVELRT